MACYLCNGEKASRAEGRVRDMPHIGILRCDDCGLVFLDSFAHVHDNYYDSTYVSENHSGQDWQHYLNECRADDDRRLTQIQPYLCNRRYLDIGCGAGGVLLRAREHCLGVMGVEPQSVWRGFLAEAGIPIHADISEIADHGVDVVSLFHVLEHIPDPIPFLQKLHSKISNGGTLIIEVPNADDALLQLYRSKSFSEFTYWSPHLFLYTAHTLGLLLRRAGYTAIQIQQYQRYPLSNHLHWLAQGKPGGHVAWSFLDSDALHAAYTARLAALGLCDTLIATVSVTKSC